MFLINTFCTLDIDYDLYHVKFKLVWCISFAIFSPTANMTVEHNFEMNTIGFIYTDDFSFLSSCYV